MVAEAWVMETKDCKYQWEGSGLMKAKNNSPYGGELYGMYLILRFVKKCGMEHADSKEKYE